LDGSRRCERMDRQERPDKTGLGEGGLAYRSGSATGEDAGRCVGFKKAPAAEQNSKSGLPRPADDRTPTNRTGQPEQASGDLESGDREQLGKLSRRLNAYFAGRFEQIAPASDRIDLNRSSNGHHRGAVNGHVEPKGLSAPGKRNGSAQLPDPQVAEIKS